MASIHPPLTPEVRAALVAYEVLYARWRAADEAARRAEQVLEARCRCHAGSPPPDLSLEAEALQLRLQASCLAGQAVAIMRAVPI